MSFAEWQSRWAQLFVRTLGELGLKDAVVSPGSRSTPLVLALAELPSLTIHDIIDERSAGFFALGSAKLTGCPTLLVCTSGTAAAHYFSAVIEASLSFTPLIVITADRPTELHMSGASQTVDQMKLFGDYARLYLDLGIAEPGEESILGIRRKASQAFAVSQFPTPGPVQVNAPFRKPLEPDSETSNAVTFQSETTARPAIVVESGPPKLSNEIIDQLALACQEAERGLIVCGPVSPSGDKYQRKIETLVGATGFPLLAEGSSQLRFVGSDAERPVRCDAFDAVLRSPEARLSLATDLVIQLGPMPTSKWFGEYLKSLPHIRRFVISPHGWQDPLNAAESILISDVADTCSRLSERLPANMSNEGWRKSWAAADKAASECVLETVRHGGEELLPASICHTVFEHVPRESLVVVGNGLVIRDIDWFCSGDMATAGVLSQRGAAGIGGMMSQAFGAASKTDEPVTVLIGDETFLHDLHALVIAKKIKKSVVVVVVNNNGGRIFEHLPVANNPRYSDTVEEHFVMPHQVDVSSVAGSFGSASARVTDVTALDIALSEAYLESGVTIIDAIVSPEAAGNHYTTLFGNIEKAMLELFAMDEGPEMDRMPDA